MRYSLNLLAACLLFIFACENVAGPAADREIILEKAFSLRPPQKAQSADISVRVLQIDDSRCPLNVNCIWEGEVTVKLGVQQGARVEEVALTLHRPEQDGRNIAEIGGYRISLESVSMPPGSDANWTLEDYEVGLLITSI